MARRDIGSYAGRGFVYIGLCGGLALFSGLEWLRTHSAKGSSINTVYQEAPLWGWGLAMMSGPLLGCLYWLIFIRE